MVSAATKIKIWQIILIVVVLALLIIMIIPDKEKRTDIANQYMLEAILEYDGFTNSDVHIQDETILVSIEVSEAGEYDAQLVAWWGTIFGNAALLKGYEKTYQYVIIENLVNGEPYTYVSVNLVTVDDFVNVQIDDGTFWDEVLITDHKPKTKEIVEQTMLPASALVRDTTSNTYTPKKDRNLSWLWPLLILLCIAGIVLGVIHENKVKKAAHTAAHHAKKVSGEVKKQVKKHSKTVQKHKKKLTKKKK